MDKATRIALALAVLLAGSEVFSATSIELESAENDVGDVSSLQRGARNFMNYCSGCHSAKYVRFYSMADDLQLSNDQLIENLVKGDAKKAAALRELLGPPDTFDVPEVRH